MSNYGPQEDAYALYTEKTFMLSSFIYTIGYGVQLVLYFNCASLFLQQRHRQRKYTFVRLAYITVLLILASLIAATAIWVLVDMYIENRNYPGGPMAYFLDTNQPLGTTVFGSLFASNFMGDLLVLWRCWVIWRPAGKLAANAVICVPVLMLLSFLALGIIWGYQTRPPGLSLYSRLSLNVGVAYSVMTLGLNLLLTCLIITRLLLYRRAVLNALPSDYTKHYLSLASIIIESALLYSLCGVAFIITYVLESPWYRIFLYTAVACQPIAGYMIILRVAQGRAWTSNTPALATGSTDARFTRPEISTQGAVESRLDYPCNKESPSMVETKSNMGDSV